MVYRFAVGAHLPKGLDAQTVGDRLAQLRDDLGAGFRPGAVVSDAESALSPLHPAFTWDDGEAARKRREDEARYLIRHVVVVREAETPDQQPREVRAFVSVVERVSEQDRYMPVVQAMSDDEYRDQIVDRALREAIAWRHRYEDIKEFSRIFAAIDRTAQQRRAGMELKKAA